VRHSVVRADRHRGATVSGRDVGEEEDGDEPLFGRRQMVVKVVAVHVPAAAPLEPGEQNRPPAEVVVDHRTTSSHDLIQRLHETRVQHSIEQIIREQLSNVNHPLMPRGWVVGRKSELPPDERPALGGHFAGESTAQHDVPVCHEPFDLSLREDHAASGGTAAESQRV
jgi:hypothetical protein